MGIQAALPCEVDGQQRKHEQAGIAKVKGLREGEAEQLRHLDGHRRGQREQECDGGFAVRNLRGLIVCRRDDQLFPQTLGVFPRELPRQRIEAAHALDRDQESFIPCQAGLGERYQLVAQMTL